jgi:hypothetical protein
LTTLLHIRYLQLKRELRDGGIRSLFLFGILILLVYASYNVYKNNLYAWYLTGFLFYLCVFIHVIRTDKTFAFGNINSPRSQFFAEYFFLTLPFSVTACFTTNWYFCPVLTLSLIFVPWFKSSKQKVTYFKNLSTIIPASNFELISGFRKSFLYLIPLYALAIIFCWVRFAPLFLLWFITVTIATFYNECESLNILREGKSRPGEFLRNKILSHSKLPAILYLPVLLINTILNPEFLILNILFIPIQLSLISFAILLKYSNYRPGQNSVANNLTLSLVSLGIAIPYLLPLPLLMSMPYYKRAKKNLDMYLYD